MPQHKLSVRNTFLECLDPEEAAVAEADDGPQPSLAQRSATAPVAGNQERLSEVDREEDEELQPALERLDTQTSFCSSSGEQPDVTRFKTMDPFEASPQSTGPILLGSFRPLADDESKASPTRTLQPLAPVQESLNSERSPCLPPSLTVRANAADESDEDEQPGLTHCDTYNSYTSEGRGRYSRTAAPASMLHRFPPLAHEPAPSPPMLPPSLTQLLPPTMTQQAQLVAFQSLPMPMLVVPGPTFLQLPQQPVGSCHASSGGGSSISQSPAGSPVMAAAKPAAVGAPMPRGETRTTVMFRNLPNNYTRSMLVSLLDAQGFQGAYDFVYFPIDFRTHAAMGYAFINAVSGEEAVRIRRHFDGFAQWSVPSGKRCTVGWSDPHQGFDSNVQRYRNSPLMHESVPEHYRPIIFNNGVRIPFPEPTKRIKPPRQGTERMLV